MHASSIAILLAAIAPASGAAPAARAPLAAAAALDPIALLAEYIRIDTSNPPGNEERSARWLAALLARDEIRSELVEIAPGRACLVARLQGDRSKKALLLSSHMDVVHADPSRWSVPPFSGDVRDGFLYGRGTLDMKATGLLQALALIRLKRERVPLARDVVLVATADEEVDALGMTRLIELRPDVFRDVELSLTEGETIEVADGRVRAWNVAVSEKAALWLRLIASGRAGHGSVPFEEDNAVVALLRALERVRRWETPIKVLPATRRAFASLKDRYRGLDPAKLARLEESLREPVFRAAFLAEPERAAAVHNTVSITVLKGGPQTNVIPSTASAELDCRLLPGEDPAAFIEALRVVIADPSVRIETISPVVPASASRDDTDLFRAIEAAAARHDPGVPVVSTILFGWTESALLRPLGIQAYGFEPYALSKEENRRTHGDDERISLENVERGGEILYEIVKTVAAKAP